MRYSLLSDVVGTNDRIKTILVILFLISIVLIVYWPVQHHAFINYDDNGYVTNNPYVQKGLTKDGLWWALKTGQGGNWNPLIWLSLMLDYELFKLNPGGYHWTNVLFHIANTLLLFFVLYRMTGGMRQSAFVSVVFAIHPLHVESVAWVAERKDVLSAFFWMLTLWLYASYVSRPGCIRYLFVLAAFIAGLMSKPMTVTLPFVLLLLDFWPLRRFTSSRPIYNDSEITSSDTPQKYTRPLILLILEKIPFFILSGAVSVATLLISKEQKIIASFQTIPLELRIQNAVISYGEYIYKMLWPQNLAIYYPFPDSLPLWPVLMSFILLSGLTVLIIIRARQFPYLLVGWFWYLGTLVPVIGLVQAGTQAMADRYTYIPMIGLLMMIAWGTSDILKRSGHQIIIAPVVAAIITILAIASHFQINHWRDSISLFRHATEVTANNYLAYDNLGIALMNKGRFEEAMVCFKEAIKIKPSYVSPYNNLANIFLALNKPGIAIDYFRQAIRINPMFSDAHYNLGTVLVNSGRMDDGISHLRLSLAINPDCADAHINLGAALVKKGLYAEAKEEFSKALEINPHHEVALRYRDLIMTINRQGSK